MRNRLRRQNPNHAARRSGVESGTTRIRWNIFSATLFAATNTLLLICCLQSYFLVPYYETVPALEDELRKEKMKTKEL